MKSKIDKSLTVYNEIDPKHAELVDYYLTNKCNRVEAYKHFHPSVTYGTAAAHFNVIMNRPEVKEYYNTINTALREQTNVKAADIVNQLGTYIHADRTVFAGLSEEEIKQLPNDQKALIQDIKTKTREYKVGNQVVKEKTIEVKLVPKLDSLKELNKMQGNYSEHNKQRAVKIDIKQLNVHTLNALLAASVEPNNNDEA